MAGTISAGPTCPVERVDHPCPPRPVEAEVDARRSTGEVVGATRSDAQGRYAIALPAGSYTLSVVVNNGQPWCPTTDVQVHDGRVTRADISCDTGIR